MILPFSTQFKDGTSTYFIQKIWESLLREQLIGLWSHIYYLDDYESHFGKKWDIQEGGIVIPKPHTIREDKHDRWHEGSLIHPVVFNRSKNQFQFAPTMICKSVQKIEIKYFEKGIPKILIDNVEASRSTMKLIAKNDGFSSPAQFIGWFSKDFTGKIIHWTSLKY